MPHNILHSNDNLLSLSLCRILYVKYAGEPQKRPESQRQKARRIKYEEVVSS
jgi:hypothetical protein